MYLALDCALRKMLPHARLLVPSATFSKCGRTTADDHDSRLCQSRPVRVRRAVPWADTRVPNGNPGGTARGDGLGGPSASRLGVLACMHACVRVSEWRSSRPARSSRSSEGRCVQTRDEVGSRMLGKELGRSVRRSERC